MENLMEEKAESRISSRRMRPNPRSPALFWVGWRGRAPTIPLNEWGRSELVQHASVQMTVSCLWSGTKRMFAMTNKTLRNSLTALAAFAIAVTSVIASSLAAEFTVHQGKRYRATLALKSVERLVDNALIAQKFRDLGFSGVRVSGAGATRRVEGIWPGKDTSANLPPQIIAVARL